MEAQQGIDAAIWRVLARPGIFLDTVGDIDLLPKVLDAARRFDERHSQAGLEKHLPTVAFDPLFI